MSVVVPVVDAPHAVVLPEIVITPTLRKRVTARGRVELDYGLAARVGGMTIRQPLSREEWLALSALPVRSWIGLPVEASET